jgi:ornithine decarboxylase
MLECLPVNIELFDKDLSLDKIIHSFIKKNITEEPFYIVNISNIINSYDKWNKLLPNIQPYYAIKCNSNPILLQTLSLVKCNFDCASEKEIKIILEITNDPNRIIFANPCKISSHLQFANANNVSLMTFDCEEELYKIQKYYPLARLLIRIAVDDTNSLCKFSSKFGCKITEVENLLEQSKQLGLFIEGVSFHVGSGCMSADNFYHAIHDCKKVVDIARKINVSIKMVDIGGGFPGNNKKICFEDIAKSIHNGINDFFSEEVKNNEIQFIAEPGRYFAQNSHILVLCITGKKYSIDEKGEKLFLYYLNDGIYNSFNCIIFDHAIVDIIPLISRDGPIYQSKLFGPTCDSMDVIKENILLPEYFIGDYFYVEDFGAYTVSPSSGFNGFTTSMNKYIMT